MVEAGAQHVQTGGLKEVDDKKTNTPPRASCPGERAGAGSPAEVEKKLCIGSGANASGKSPCTGLRC